MAVKAPKLSNSASFLPKVTNSLPLQVPSNVTEFRNNKKSADVGDG